MFRLLLYLLLLLLSLAAAAFGGMNYLTLTRGIENDFPVTQKIVGTNVALEQYAALETYATDAELQRALDALKGAGFTHARQYFSWREIENTRGVYAWAKGDRLVNAARAQGIEIVAVLDTAPAWSQRAQEREMPNAPPDDFSEYARFVGDFAKRYGDTIRFYQIWDEPNVEPHWGKRNADAVEYAQLLIPASQAIRAHDANAVIVLAGLAMNLELRRPHPNYSEILFLRGLYEIGAQKYFDLVAAKPYGLWTGPEDRTVNSGVLNFSRLILLRDEMRQYGDQAKPIWAVEMGWNALPENWSGAPSPWGTDAESVQADRLLRGLARAETEWSWLTGAFPMYLQPNVSADNPRWGFALMASDGKPRGLYDALRRYFLADSSLVLSPPLPVAPIFPIALLLAVALVSAWRVWHYVFLLRLDERWRTLKTRVNTFPELAQFLIVIITAIAFYVSPNTLLNFVLLAALIFLFALRLDFGIALTIFAIPFWNYPKTLFGGFQLSPVEVLTWSAATAFLLDAILTKRVLCIPYFVRSTFRASLFTLYSLDWAVLAFLLLALLSTQWAGNFGVASREFRIIVFDPILLYALIRLTPGPSPKNQKTIFRRGGTPVLPSPENFSRKIFGRRAGDEAVALLASGIAVCAIGFYKFATGDVIFADGVARLISVWGSPNNIGLYLGRLLPLALAFALLLKETRARFVYAAIVALFAVTILLTYSRGALFLGVPASVLFVMLALYLQSHHLSRRAWLAIGATGVIAGIAIIPFLNSERTWSLFQTGTGTGFFRVAVWTSAVNMIRDHLVLGVGLDNFLYEYPKYILPDAWREPNLSHPHNFVLDFWARLGIGGLIIFIWMLIAFYKRAWKNFATAQDVYTRALMLGLMASVVNMLAHGLIDAAYFVVDLAYLFLLTLALAQTSGKK